MLQKHQNNRIFVQDCVNWEFALEIACNVAWFYLKFTLMLKSEEGPILSSSSSRLFCFGCLSVLMLLLFTLDRSMRGAPTPSLMLGLVVFTVREGGEMNWSPSFHGRRFILGIEMASHGTRGFLIKELKSKIFHLRMSTTYRWEGFLKLSGCISLILSPLSQWTLARLDFLTSTSWWALNLPGLVSPMS